MLLISSTDMEVDPTKEELSKLTTEITHNMALLQHDQLESIMLDCCTKLVRGILGFPLTYQAYMTSQFVNRFKHTGPSMKNTSAKKLR